MHLDHPIVLALGAASLLCAPSHALPQESEGITWKDLLGSGSSLRFYGFVRLDAQWDDSRFNDPAIPIWVLSEDGNPPGGVPNGVVAPDADQSEFSLSARLTRLGMDLKAPPITGMGDPALTGKIEIDFYNIGLNDADSRNAIRMRLAYLDLDWGSWSLLAGQDWDVISPLFAAVNSDIMMWGAGNLGDRRPQLTLKNVSQLGEQSSVVTEFGIALTGAVGGSSVSGGLRSGEASGQPMVNARVGVEGKTDSGGAWQAGVWGHVSQERFDATGAGEDRYDSDSVGVDFRVPLSGSKAWFMGEAWTGKNLSDVRGGILQGVNPSTGDEISATGGFLELGYQATEHMTLFVGYSEDDPDDDDLNPFMRAKNTIPYVAARWKYGALNCGVEVLDWTTEYVDLEDGDALRAVGWVSFSF